MKISYVCMRTFMCVSHFDMCQVDKLISFILFKWWLILSSKLALIYANTHQYQWRYKHVGFYLPTHAGMKKGDIISNFW